MSSPLRFPASSSSPIRFPHTTSSANPAVSEVHAGDVSAGLSSPQLARTRNRGLLSLQNSPRQSSQGGVGHGEDRTLLTSSQDPSAAARLIWGTTINITETTTVFKAFLRQFRIRYRLDEYEESARQPVDADDEPYYPKLLDHLRRQISYNFNLDCANLRAYPSTRKLYEQLIKYPQEIIPLMDYTLAQFFEELYPGEENYDSLNLKVRPFNLKESVNMRNLNPSDIDQLVTVKGILIRASTILPDLKSAFYRCVQCDHTVTVGIDRGRINEPTRCPREVCKGQNTMMLIHNRCEFTDKQVCRLQETPDLIPDGQTPHSVAICMYDDLVDVCKPGDRLEITGIYRSVPVRVNPRMRTIKTLFKTFVDVVHIQKSDKRRLAADRSIAMDNVDTEFDDSEDLGATTLEEEQTILELSRDSDIYGILARSLAPSIYELEDIKKGVLLQLFGGTNKTFQKSGAPRYRGDINVLLVGDPGTSKSQLLSYVHRIAPRGVYTSGKGSSAVGLTAYVTRDPDTKQLVLESGALVMSDGGVCCIDEFDKMSDATRSVLHEVMEQQTVSVAKAGIITTLNARTSILACANPKFSRWNPRVPIPQNIDLPPPLLSRFDLVYILLDKPDEYSDRRLAKHLVGLYFEDVPEGSTTNSISFEMLTKYISHARMKVNPAITDSAEKLLIDAYVELRSLGETTHGQNRRITATTRQLESMIRLSEAHARMRLSPTVEVADVEEACRLLREAIKEYATDPVTGLIDMDMINTGTSAFSRTLRQSLKRELSKAIMSHASNVVKWTALAKEIGERSSVPVHPRDFEAVMDQLQQEGLIRISGFRDNRLVHRLVSSAFETQ